MGEGPVDLHHHRLLVVGVPTVYQLLNGRLIGWLLLAVLLVPLVCTVRGYTITDTDLEVARLGWTSRWPLADLQSATVERGVMARSFRTFGNGGLFAITGRTATRGSAPTMPTSPTPSER